MSYITEFEKVTKLGELFSDAVINELTFSKVFEISKDLKADYGDTVKYNTFDYEGGAQFVLEGGEIVARQLSQTSKSVDVVKIGDAIVSTYEESKRVGKDKLENEIFTQLKSSIVDKINEETYKVLGSTTNVINQLNADKLVRRDILNATKALDKKFRNSEKVLVVSHDTFADLYDQPGFITLEGVLVKGTVGSYLGYEIFPVDELEDAGYSLVIAKDAFRIDYNEEFLLEAENMPSTQKDAAYASSVFAMFIKNAGGVVKIMKETVDTE